MRGTLTVVSGLMHFTIAATDQVPASDSLQTIWRTSLPFPVFLEATRGHTNAWHEGYQRATVPDSLLDRARNEAGRWRVLVVTDVGCHDSLGSIPALARLAEAVDGFEVRVTDSRTGTRVTDARRTRDGRTATPTIVVLDDAWKEAGAIVEHPRALIEFLVEHRLRREDAGFREQVLNWYESDGGVGVIAEILDMMRRPERMSSTSSSGRGYWDRYDQAPERRIPREMTQ